MQNNVLVHDFCSIVSRMRMGQIYMLLISITSLLLANCNLRIQTYTASPCRRSQNSII